MVLSVSRLTRFSAAPLTSINTHLSFAKVSLQLQSCRRFFSRSTITGVQHNFFAHHHREDRTLSSRHVERRKSIGKFDVENDLNDQEEEECVAVEITPLSDLVPTQTLKLVRNQSSPIKGPPGTGIKRTRSRRKLHSEMSMSTESDSKNRALVTVPEIPSSQANHAYDVFREMAPYIAVHYNSVVVVHIPGEVLESDQVDQIMHDIVLLKTLGMKLVLVAGCRPQIRKRLLENGIKSSFVNGNRVCDEETLKHCQSVAGSVRVEIESRLGRGLLNAPIATSVQVLSGNFVKAIPYGVRGGVDFKFSGLVQKVKAKNIHALLDQGNIVLLGHLGYSHSSHVFHCRSEEVATTAAMDLKADKLIFFHNGESLVDATDNRLVHNLSLNTAYKFCNKLRSELGQDDDRIKHDDGPPLLEWKVQFLDYLLGATKAIENGVERVHLVSRKEPGALITELCTREGAGLMVSYEVYDSIRKASIKDIPALLNLIQPLEKQGILVTRPPSLLELEAENFYVFERDGAVLACFQYKNYKDTRYPGGASEMSCVAVAPEIQKDGIGTALLTYFMRKCLLEGVHHAFVLTTRSSHWFEAHGFIEQPPQKLPPKKYEKYDFSRMSKVYFKLITDEKQIEQEEVLWANNKKR